MDHPHARAYFLAIVTTLLTVLTVYMLRPFLVTVGLASVFAVIFAPLHRALMRRRLPPSLSALATLLIGLVVVIIPLSFLSVQLFREAENVYTALSQPGTLAHTQTALTTFGASLDTTVPGAGAYFASLSTHISEYARVGLSWVIAHAGGFFSTTLSFLLQFFVFLMTLFYFIKEGHRLMYAAKRFSPLHPVETGALVSRLTSTINSIVRGTLTIALIQGVLAALGLFIFGVPNAVLWGTVAVIGALIPSVGTALVFIPSVLYLFFVGHSGSAILLGIYGLFGVGIVDNFLRPYLVGGATIHPLLVLLSVLGGISFFGPGGLFLGPLVVSLLLGLLSLYAPAREHADPA